MKRNIKFLLTSFVFSLLFLSICSKCSPLYPFNDWVDPNCFLTVGRSMLKGLLPYRDLFEQKGPIVYFLHAGAAAVSSTGFLGVFLAELACGTAFLYLSYKILGLFCEKPSPLHLALVAFCTYASTAFCQGDSAEEMCLPIMALCLYYFLKIIQEGKVPNSKDGIILGVTGGAVLWIKFSMLGFFVGVTVTLFLYVYDKKVIKSCLFPLCGGVFGGLLVITAPIIIFFAANGGLNELFTVYFYHNLFSYSSSSVPVFGSFFNVINGGIKGMQSNFLPMATFPFVVYRFLKSYGKDSARLLLLSFVFMLVTVYCGGRHYRYYSLIFSVFLPCAISAFVPYAKTATKLNNYAIKLAAVLVLVALAFFVSANTRDIGKRREELPQYVFAEIINSRENPSLLNYRFLDGGFYNAAGIVPDCRYFCELNVPIEEMYRTQDRYVRQCLCDFVVTRDEVLTNRNYTCVKTIVYPYEGKNRTYRLYQLNN